MIVHCIHSTLGIYKVLLCCPLESVHHRGHLLWGVYVDVQLVGQPTETLVFVRAVLRKIFVYVYCTFPTIPFQRDTVSFYLGRRKKELWWREFKTRHFVMCSILFRELPEFVPHVLLYTHLDNDTVELLVG